MIDNSDILEEMKSYNNWSRSTEYSYERSIELYTNFHNLPMNELIREAEVEEEQGVLLRKRKIKERLMLFQKYLKEQNYKSSSIITMIAKIKATYHFYELSLPNLPAIKNKSYETINDIPNKEQIRKALELTSNINMKALILFMASSGTARNEAANLTVQDYINATYEYHEEVNYRKAILILENKDNIVPIFNMVRLKTNYPYYTFCTPESSNMINRMLKYRLLNKNLQPNDRLFNMKATTMTSLFGRLNDKCCFGWKTTRRFFHPHNLRKYFISTLFNEGLDFYTIEFMCGHKIGSVQEAYYKANPEKQRKKYLEFMNKLTINNQVIYMDILNNEKKELEELKKYKKETEERILRLEEIINVLLPD